MYTDIFAIYQDIFMLFLRNFRLQPQIGAIIGAKIGVILTPLFWFIGAKA